VAAEAASATAPMVTAVAKAEAAGAGAATKAKLQAKATAAAMRQSMRSISVWRGKAQLVGGARFGKLQELSTLLASPEFRIQGHKNDMIIILIYYFIYWLLIIQLNY
jgi:hypothetical protein